MIFFSIALADSGGSSVMTVASINGISFQPPPISLQSQFDEINNSGINFCSRDKLPKTCIGMSRQYCNCVHLIKIPLGSIVELIIVDETPIPGLVPHPFHVHGTQLYVTEIGQVFNESMSIARAEEIITSRRVSTERSSINFYPVKDTVSIPSSGFAVMRFRADNPGFWFVCLSIIIIFSHIYIAFFLNCRLVHCHL